MTTKTTGDIFLTFGPHVVDVEEVSDRREINNWIDELSVIISDPFQDLSYEDYVIGQPWHIEFEETNDTYYVYPSDVVMYLPKNDEKKAVYYSITNDEKSEIMSLLKEIMQKYE